MKTLPLIALPVLLLLAATPDVAHACAVCFDPRAETRIAFLATTAFMSLFPLSMVGGLGIWLRRRSRQVREQADRGEENPEE